MNLPGMMNVPQHDRTVAGFNVTLTLRKTSTHFAVSTPSYESSLFVRAVAIAGDHRSIPAARTASRGAFTTHA